MSPRDEIAKEHRKKLSERKVRANRNNALQSRGPKNTRRTRLNALRHGLLGDRISDFDFSAGHNEVLQKLIEEKTPVGKTEKHLVERIAFYMIRIRRARLLEADLLNHSIDDLPALHEQSVGPKVRPQRTLVETAVRTYRRYESTFTMRMIKVLRDLERLQQHRREAATL